MGGSGVRLERGTRNTIQSNDIFETAGAGLELIRLGDRASLTTADTHILNNHIHHIGRLAYREAIHMDACIGITVAHNLLHDLPKSAVRTDLANDCTFEFNEIHNNALSESDNGTFYNYGGWTTYGNTGMSIATTLPITPIAPTDSTAMMATAGITSPRTSSMEALTP